MSAPTSQSSSQASQTLHTAQASYTAQASGPSQIPASMDAVDAADSRAAAADRLERLPARVLGALLLVGALDPARWPDYLCPQWFFGAFAIAAGLWAGAPVVRRPVTDSHRWRDLAERHRNTLLAAASVLLAALQSPPVWLMAAETLLLLVYLMLVDAGAVAAGPARTRLGQALCAIGAAAVVLLAAVAPVTGGWWGRFVAGVAVLGALGLVYAALRLRRPAGYPRETRREPEPRRPNGPRRH